MKDVIISADGELKVYAVPDAVADNLADYCVTFCDDWLRNSPDAAQYRIGDAVCYNEEDFIDYLNTWLFPQEPSVLVANLGFIHPAKVPPEYRACPRFNF